MEIVEDSGFDSDHKTSASVPMAEESEQNKIHEVCYMIIYNFFSCNVVSACYSNGICRYKADEDSCRKRILKAREFTANYTTAESSFSFGGTKTQSFVAGKKLEWEHPV